MNGSAAKSERRELRRTVGAEAAAVVDAHTGILHHQVIPNLNALQRDVDRLQTCRVQDQHDQRGYVDAQNRHLRARIERFERLTFLGRLRWLVGL